MAGLILLLLSCVACAHAPMTSDESLPGAPTRLDTASDESVDLRVGETAAVPGSSSVITFVRVASDSRCPKGVTCIWEGDAVVELRVQTKDGEARSAQLHTNERFERQAQIEGVTVTLDRLEPYPAADAPPSADRYVATLRIGPS